MAGMVNGRIPIKPSLKAILWHDWPALACWIGIAVAWALFAVRLVLQRHRPMDLVFLAGVLLASVALAGLVLWRVLRVYRLFARGTPAPGRMTSLMIVKDRGRLEFAYESAGQPLTGWAPVHRCARVLALTPGRQVCVLTDPNRPRHAIVAELFAATLPQAPPIPDTEDTSTS